MKKRQRTAVAPIHMLAGDTLKVTWDGAGPEGEVLLHTEEVGRALTVDTVATFDVEPADGLGFKDGIAVVLGEGESTG